MSQVGESPVSMYSLHNIQASILDSHTRKDLEFKRP